MTVALVSSEGCHLCNSLYLCWIWWVAFSWKYTSKESYRVLLDCTFWAVENKSLFLGYIEQVYYVCVMLSVISAIDENMSLWIANTPGHCATMSSILIWKISWLILSLNGTLRNLYLPKCVLNIVSSDASFVRCIPKNDFVAIDFGEFGGSCENMCYLFKGWSFVILMDYGFI